MPAAIPFIPLIASGIGAAATIYQGNKQQQANQAALNQANQATQAQQQLIGQMMSGMSPDAYRAQAKQAGDAALSQLASDFAQRGMLSSGALHTVGAQTLGQLYTDANAKYQQDRMNAYNVALGGQRGIQGQYADQVNPNPYGGLGGALSGLGTAAGQFFASKQASTSAYPSVTTTGASPYFGVKYK